MPAQPTRRLLLGAVLAAPALPLRAQVVPAVTVGSKLDTESAMLGQMIALALEAKGVPVRPRLQLGPTRIMRQAILAGEVDIYPEYTGNGAFFFQQETDPAWRRADTAFERVRGLDAERNGLLWLPRAPANNTWAIAMREDAAGGIRSLDDLARHLAGGGAFRLAASAEFVESPAALPSFQSTYGFTLRPEQMLILPGGDTAVTMRAAAEGLNGVNAAMVYGTDGAISALSLRVLEDAKGAQIVYEPAPVVRKPVADRLPALADWLGPVFASLTAERLRALNARIVVEGRPVREVAQEHLRSLGASR
ncbi:glycine betaine ABC transporter substrate-binding protein OsmF [Muricoccus pecuniae]|uniref:Osmoprotectant transport system substrate-binding protein n=1 Tax=Muricoccus pecuniae TaxID=693023 RepID=A0A840YJ78_9PROT|nr:ABC transporter substrate-binding protein [Roseomonas pecuniae]MBB5694732.1 osmoprotectant transport system substrate-binding protein [Roseomonas pecuniae]